LKPPGFFNPWCAYEVKNWYQAFAFKWVNLCRCVLGDVLFFSLTAFSTGGGRTS
jgi:hypothetical protein